MIQSDSDDSNEAVATLKEEIRLIEHRIQEEEARIELEAEVEQSKKSRELSSLTQQLQSLKEAVDHEKRICATLQKEVEHRKGVAQEPEVQESNAEVFSQLTDQQARLEDELQSLCDQLAEEVGPELDVDTILRNGSSANARIEKLRTLEGRLAKANSYQSTNSEKTGIAQASERVFKEFDTLVNDEAKARSAIQRFEDQIARNAEELARLEERNRVLTSLSNVLDEKLAHDNGLIEYLEEHSSGTSSTVPPFTGEFLDHLGNQQRILAGLFHSLAAMQKNGQGKARADEIPLVDKLNTINRQCIALQKRILLREHQETNRIVAHLDEG